MTVALKLANPDDLDLPGGDELVDLEEELIRQVRVIVGLIGASAAADAIGRSASWMSRALSPTREQRIGSRCRFYLEDLVMLLRAARELDSHGLIEFLAALAFGDQLPAEDVASAWAEVTGEQLGELARPLKAAVAARARSKRLRAVMRTRRAPGTERGR